MGHTQRWTMEILAFLFLVSVCGTASHSTCSLPKCVWMCPWTDWKPFCLLDADTFQWAAMADIGRGRVDMASPSHPLKRLSSSWFVVISCRYTKNSKYHRNAIVAGSLPRIPLGSTVPLTECGATAWHRGEGNRKLKNGHRIGIMGNERRERTRRVTRQKRNEPSRALPRLCKMLDLPVVNCINWCVCFCVWL